MAAVKLYDLARMTTATVGTGTITLGTAVPPFLTFAQAGVQDGDLVRYAIYDPLGGVVEIGSGTYTASGTTLTRSPTTSSNGGGTVALSGSAQVLITASVNDFFPGNIASTATGDLFYKNSSGTVSRLPIGTAGQSLGIASGIPAWGASARTQLTATANYYVNASSSAGVAGPSGGVVVGGGNDTTGNGTAAAPWKTLQKAYNWIVANIDFAALYTANIYLAHGSSTNYSLVATDGPFVGTSVVNVIGDSSDQSLVTIQAPTNGYGLQIKDLACLDYSFVTFADNGSTNGLGHIIAGVGNYGHLDIGNCTLAAINTNTMVQATYGGSITFLGPMKITGGAGIAFSSTDGGVIDCTTQVFTITGTPAFSVCFGYILNNGVIAATTSTFSGSATGQKFQIYGNTTLGAYDPASVFPGNSPGLTTLANTPVSLTGTVTLPDGSIWSASGLIASIGNIATIYGGSAANETFTLQSTSNVSPSGDTLILHASTLEFICGGGTGAWYINQNAALTNFNAGVGATLYGLDTANTGWSVNTFGASPINIFTRYNGTSASITGILATNEIMRISASGYDGTNVISGTHGGQKARFSFFAFNNWSGSDNSTYATVQLTPSASTSLAETFRFFSSGGVGINTTSDPGAGLFYTNSASFLGRTKTSLTGGATGNVPTLTAGPANGNPTKWLPYDDNGTTRYIPAW